jgi:hypothetical protein
MPALRFPLLALASLLVCRAALAQEVAARPVAQEATEEEKAAQRKDQAQPEQAAKLVSQEPTAEERAAQQGDQRHAPLTAADWALRNESPAQAQQATAAPQAATTAPAPAPTGSPSASIGLGSPAVNAPGGLASASAAPRNVIEISGYAILGASWTQQDPNLVYVGRNNGFTLADARIELTARPTDTIWLYLSVDGAVAAPSATDPTQGSRVVQLKDAYGVWAPGNHLRVQAGQFKAPQGVEELLEETDLKFVTRSIVSIGAGAPFGYAADPLSLDRQLGIGVGSDRIPFGEGGLTAQIAIMNGNGADQLYNDAPYPSAMGRVAYDRSGISVGLWGAFQPRALGDQPRVYRDNVFSGGADVLITRGPLHALLLASVRQTRHVTSKQPDELAVGLSGELAYRLGFIEPAVRVSYLDPSDQIATDNLLYYTAGVNLYVPGAPGRLSIDFTHRQEQAGRDLSNDGLELAAQVRF